MSARNGLEEGPRAVVETQSPDQEQQWVEADSFSDLDDALGDGVAALDGRVLTATAVRVRVGDETAWVGVANAERRVVNAPRLPPLSNGVLWDVEWEGDDPRWMLQAAAGAPKHWLAMASLQCARLARPAAKPRGVAKGFDAAARLIEQWAEDERHSPGGPTGPTLYEAYLVVFATARGYRLGAASGATLDALREIVNLRENSAAETLFRVPGYVTRAAGGGEPARVASLNAQMASIVRRWISLGVAMESCLRTGVPSGP